MQLFNLSFPLLDAVAEPAGGGASDASMSSMVDSLLSSPDPTPSTTPASDSSPTPPPEVSTPETPAAEPATEAPQAESIDTEEDNEFRPDDDIDQALADTTKPADPLDLKSPRGQRIYRSYKAYKEIADKLGQTLTPEMAEQHFQAFSDNQAMEHEFASGDPAKVENFAANWNQVSPQGMQQLAGTLPDFLAKNNQDGYVAMATPILKRFINQLYVNADQAPAESKAALRYVAELCDYNVFGTFRNGANQPQASQPDALSQREQQLMERENRIRQYEQSQSQKLASDWNEGTKQAMDSALQAEIASVLQPLKATLKPHEFKAAQRDLMEAVNQRVDKDVEGKRLFGVEHQKRLRTMSSEDRDALVNVFMARTSRMVRQAAPSIIKEWGTKAAQTNTAVHQQLATSAAAGTQPSGGGAPVNQSITPPRQFSSQAEKRDAMIDALLRS